MLSYEYNYVIYLCFKCAMPIVKIPNDKEGWDAHLLLMQQEEVKNKNAFNRLLLADTFVMTTLGILSLGVVTMIFTIPLFFVWDNFFTKKLKKIEKYLDKVPHHTKKDKPSANQADNSHKDKNKTLLFSDNESKNQTWELTVSKKTISNIQKNDNAKEYLTDQRVHRNTEYLLYKTKTDFPRYPEINLFKKSSDKYALKQPPYQFKFPRKDDDFNDFIVKSKELFGENFTNYLKYNLNQESAVQAIQNYFSLNAMSLNLTPIPVIIKIDIFMSDGKFFLTEHFGIQCFDSRLLEKNYSKENTPENLKKLKLKEYEYIEIISTKELMLAQNTESYEGKITEIKIKGKCDKQKRETARFLLEPNYNSNDKLKTQAKN